jgi:periplasmic copper chaperone A
MTRTTGSRLLPFLSASLLLLTTAVGGALVPPAAAHAFKAGALTIKHPWTRASAGRTGAGYAEIINSGSTPDRLVSATSPAAATVEIHTMTMDGGIMRMRALPDGLAIAARGAAALKSGGAHLMLIGLKAPLVEGTLVPLTLRFAKGGPVKVELKVEAAGATGPAHANHGQ